MILVRILGSRVFRKAISTQKKDYLKIKKEVSDSNGNLSIGFLEVESLPQSKYNFWLYQDGEVIADSTRNLKQEKNNKKAEIKIAKKRNQLKNVKVGDFIFAGGRDSAIKVDETVRLSQKAGLESFEIGTADGEILSVGLDEANSIILAIGGYTQACWKQEQLLRKQIDSCTTMEDVEAVEWIEIDTGV